MEKEIFGPLQFREIFHLEFLRRFARGIKRGRYALKGGANLRFFFNSARYSEDMDLDISGMEVDAVKESVLKILDAGSFRETLRPFGIERIVPPDIIRAKQTQTTQRFKVHLITGSGEDLFTEIELSRRGINGNAPVESVPDIILREYRLPPLMVAHYDLFSTVRQKISALASRSVVQARDVFDLYILSSQHKPGRIETTGISRAELSAARHNLFGIGFEQFRDTVISYLPLAEQRIYGQPSLWDEVKLKADAFLDEFKAGDG